MTLAIVLEMPAGTIFQDEAGVHKSPGDFGAVLNGTPDEFVGAIRVTAGSPLECKLMNVVEISPIGFLNVQDRDTNEIYTVFVGTDPEEEMTEEEQFEQVRRVEEFLVKRLNILSKGNRTAAYAMIENKGL